MGCRQPAWQCLGPPQLLHLSLHLLAATSLPGLIELRPNVATLICYPVLLRAPLTLCVFQTPFATMSLLSCHYCMLLRVSANDPASCMNCECQRLRDLAAYFLVTKELNSLLLSLAASSASIGLTVAANHDILGHTTAGQAIRQAGQARRSKAT